MLARSSLTVMLHFHVLSRYKKVDGQAAVRMQPAISNAPNNSRIVLTSFHLSLTFHRSTNRQRWDAHAHAHAHALTMTRVLSP